MRLCFLTNELYPLKPGGIGRMMYNFALLNSEQPEPVAIHFLVLNLTPAERQELEAYYRGRASFHACPPLESVPDDIAQSICGDRAFHPDWAAHYRHAYAFHLGLLAAEARTGGPFDIVEYPDYGGWGTAILNARRSGLAHQGTRLVCRLHSSQGLVTRFEPNYHVPSSWFSAMFDLEREGIDGADTVVGHLPSIVEENATHYGFGPDWTGRTIVEFPNVALDGAPARPGRSRTPARDFLFSSRLQPFKRPDIFVRAAVAFFEANPDHGGRARLLSYGWDSDFIAHLQGLIPDTLKSRIVFEFTYTKEERDRLIRESVVIVPSNYESFCLFAYEAAMTGSSVILARDCAAFGRAERWVEDTNCLMFDGTFLDLARVMEKALTWQPSATVDTTPDAPYWLTGTLPTGGASPRKAGAATSRPGGRAAAASASRSSGAVVTGTPSRQMDQALPDAAVPAAAQVPAARGREVAARPQISAILRYGVLDEFDLNKVILAHLNSKVAHVPLHVIVHRTLHAHSAARLSGEDRIVLHAHSGTSLCPSEIQTIATSLGGDFLILAHVDYELSAEFFDLARRAVEATPDADLFSTHVRAVTEAGTTAGVTLSTGGAGGMAMLENTASQPAAVVSRAAIARIGFAPMAGEQWYEVFCRRLALTGGRIVIAPTCSISLVSETCAIGNDVKLTGCIADEAGIAAGFRARLLGLRFRHTDNPPRARKTQGLSMREFHRAVLAWPNPNPRDFEVVGVREHLGGILVHPLRKTVTIADLRHEITRPATRIRLSIANASADNQGIEFSVLCAREELTPAELEAVAAGTLPGTAVASSWIRLAPGTSDTRILPLLVREKARIYFLTRLPEGVDIEHFGWGVFCGVEFLA